MLHTGGDREPPTHGLKKFHENVKKKATGIRGLGLGLWCLTPLSTIFQLYHGSYLGGENLQPATSH